jgi:hypothetical protein
VIKFRLGCDNGHEFDAWFRSGEAYEKQAVRHLVVCPECGSHAVDKKPMAPAVVSRRAGTGANVAQSAPVTAAAGLPEPVLEALRNLKKQVLANSEDVGARFPEEARKIHFGESEERAIRGQATAGEARQLHDDGVPFGIFPDLPEDKN